MRIFENADNEFIESLSLTVVGELYSPGENIIDINDDSDCMFFIMNGVAEVVGTTGDIHAELTAGSFFGEVGIFYGVKRTASIRAKEDMIVFKLTKQALLDVSEKYSTV